MQIFKISPSSFNTHTECPQKYFISDILGYRSKPGKAAEFGTIAHRTLEYLALIKKGWQDGKVGVDKFGLKTEFETIDQINVEEIEKICGAVFVDFQKEAIGKFGEEDLKDLNKVVKEVWMSKSNPLVLDIVSMEGYFSLPINEPWAKSYSVDEEGNQKEMGFSVNGIIDLVVKEDGNTLKLIDYKTGKRKDWITGEMKEYEDLMKDIQLNIYYFCLREKYPEYKNFIISINFLRDGGPFDLCMYEKNYIDTKKKIKDKFLEIQQTTLPILKEAGVVDFVTIVS